MAQFKRIIKSTLIRNFSSALYITGDKAQSNFVVLTPFIDFDEQIKNKSDLIKNIEARKLDIDLDKIEKRWNFFKMIDDHKNILEVTRTEIFNLINKLKEDPEQNKADIEKLLLHSKLVKDDLKNIKDYSYGIEENANLGVLGLPNILHSKTPIDHEIIEHEFLSRPNDPTPSHVEIGKSQNLIEFTNPLFYFLKSEASLFDFTISNYFQKCLLDFGHIQFSNADFARSVVVEGCGANYLDKSKIFTLENLDSEKSQELNRLHIVGGASLYSFMAYFTRHSIQSSYLPLKLFAMGRIYKPVIKKPLDLFNLGQQSVIQVFVAVDDDDQKMDDILNNMKRQIIEIYEPLGYHFKLVYVPAYDLEITESLRLSIQMFSNHLQKYIEVGNLSVYDNYLSKRLLFTCNVNKEKKFVKVVGGQLLNVPKFLGCALENNYSNQCPLLNDLLQKYL